MDYSKQQIKPLYVEECRIESPCDDPNIPDASQALLCESSDDVMNGLIARNQRSNNFPYDFGYSVTASGVSANTSTSAYTVEGNSGLTKLD